MIDFSIRKDIERAIKELQINRDDFQEISKLRWKEILLKVVECFVQKTHYTHDLHWAWNRLKEPCNILRFDNNNGYRYIEELIDDKYVWFITEDSSGKFWLYEGKPEIISKVIEESYYIDEYYIVSKKYEWILCEDHHQIIHGSGETIVNKINKFKTNRPELIIL